MSTEEAVDLVRVESGKAYPIRLMHFQNGLNVIGYVIAVFPETTMVLRPYTVTVDYNEHTDNVEGYEFTPFLDQMAYFNPLDLTPVPFMNNQMIAIVRPSEHVVSNYTGVIRLREKVASTPDDEHFEILMSREVPRSTTLH